MDSSPLFRYLENTLGLTRLSRDFFAEQAAGLAAEPTAAPATVETVPQLCCLIYNEALEKPSLVEMADKLKQAVETEFTKRAMAGRIKVLWCNLREEPALPNGKIGLCLEFGSDFRSAGYTDGRSGGRSSSADVKPYDVIRLPRLQEIHENPVAKRETWKQIQLAISEFTSSTLV